MNKENLEVLPAQTQHEYLAEKLADAMKDAGKDGSVVVVPVQSEEDFTGERPTEDEPTVH
jgi:hypothetical protein